MILRVFSVLILLTLCVSCNYFSSNKNTHDLNGIINFSKVDASPSFKICKDLIDDEKTACFRTNIHQQLTKNLETTCFILEEEINETITVVLLIDKKGKVSLQELKVTELKQSELPNLEACIKKAIDGLPNLHPAIKRGIPVATQYWLPIKIKTN